MMKTMMIALAALFVAAGFAQAEVNVSGTGTVKAKPDMAVVTLAVVSEGKNASEATLDNSKTMKKLCGKIESFKIEAKDIQTSGFSVHPKYVYPDKGEARITGYTVNNSLTVTVRDLETLGKLLDDAITSGANRVSSVRWDVKDKKELLDAARKAAMADVKRKTKLYAEAGEFKLGVVKTITEERAYSDEGESGGTYRAEPMVRGDRPVINTKGGELTFKVRINVTWAIE